MEKSCSHQQALLLNNYVYTSIIYNDNDDL